MIKDWNTRPEAKHKKMWKVLKKNEGDKTMGSYYQSKILSDVMEEIENEHTSNTR